MVELDFAVVGVAEQDRAIRTLVSAFEDDPVERWLYPDQAQYRRHFPSFIAAFGGAAFHDQTVWRLGDFDAVAFWFGPGRQPDGEAVVHVLVETTSDDLHADSFATFEQMAEGHPKEPHWYLPWFGVDRELHGRGLGTHLMRKCLEIVDEGGFRRIWRRRTRERCRSTSAPGSPSPPLPRRGRVHRSRSCSAPGRQEPHATSA